MKHLAWLLLLPLASGVLFAQTTSSIVGNVPANGTVGVQYTSGSLSVSPITTAIWSWSISQGQLPPGLGISPSGNSTTISGTPTAAGTYSFTVQAVYGISTNGIRTVVTQAYTVVIAAPVSPIGISPTTLPSGAVGVTYLQYLTATGGYGAGTYSFSLELTNGGSLPPGLAISGTGAIGGTPSQAGIFIFAVHVVSLSANGAAVSASQGYTININPAPLAITTTSLPSGTVGTAYSQTLAATGGTPPYTWQTGSGSLPGGLTLSSSGTISGTPNSAGSFTFQVGVSDSAQGTAVGTFTIVIAPAALVIITTSLPGGTVGTSYTATLTATGGTLPYTWSVASGGLPAGLSISSAGVISGTPAAAGTFSVTLQVTDSEAVKATVTKAYSITVAAATVAPPSITTQAPLAGGEAGVAYTQAFAATGGTPPYTWSVSGGTAPTGLTLNASTGSLTGTPTAAGSFTFTLQVADSAARTATGSFTITVAAAVKIITPPPMVNGTTGTAYTQQYLASGGLTPYTWNVASGSIPSGLSLSAATGLLSGTPTTAGTYTFTIGVTDQYGGKDSASFTILVVGVLSITTQPPLPGGVVGVAYTQAFAATGGAAPYQWFVSTGTVPTGLTLSATTGNLTGTPTAAGTFNFTIQVADSGGRFASQAFTITVAAGLTITTATLPNGTVGTAYSQTLTAAGVSGTLTWSISTGTLPGGITLSSAGSLSGTPSAPGTFTFTVSVTGGGQTATQTFTITVTAALTITTAGPLPNGTVGTAYSQTLTAAGGTGPLTWAASSESGGVIVGNVTGLPPGISLNPSTGVLSGTPSSPGTFTFNVSVTSGGQTAVAQLAITVGVPPGPSATFTGLPATATPATQPALGITIPTAYPLAITGTVTLTFVPTSGNPVDPNVQFTTGGSTVSFTVAANSTQVVFSGATPGVQTGTVSGTITLTLDLKAAGIDITPTPAPSTTIVIPKSVPVINSGGVTVTGVTSSGFNIVVVGYATSRDMVSATVTFTAASGVTLSSSSVTVSLASVFTTWYGSSASAAYGSQFSLTMPFTIANGTSSNPLASVSVQLTNSVGNSTTVSAPY
jgi:uncharacterized membrane protein